MLFSNCWNSKTEKPLKAARESVNTHTGRNQEKNDSRLFTKYSVKLNAMIDIFKTLKDKTVKLESIPRENDSQSEREIKTFWTNKNLEG